MRASEVDHAYGNNIHILDDACLSTWLTRLSAPETRQPVVNDLIRYLYQRLLTMVVSREFPAQTVETRTRMSEVHPDQRLTAQILEPKQRVITVNLARAGTLPSQICYDLLNTLVNPEQVRQDHILASRLTAADQTVSGTLLGAAKIGGDIDGAMVLLPDPMGATGGTVVEAVRHYREVVPGNAARFIALHLIITPEYVQRIQAEAPELTIYAIRLDRGLSSKEALKRRPGELLKEERGLNDQQYIVPGAGGLGELMNNSYV